MVDLLVACLQSIEAASRSDDPTSTIRQFGPDDQTSTLEVLVVDNASSDDVIDRVSAQFPWVNLIASETNLGFTAGNNRGYAASRGRFVYFLNPDTEIVCDETVGDSLWTLYSVVRDNETVGMAGPQLRYGDGTLQRSTRRFPTRLTGFFESTWLGAALARQSVGAANAHGRLAGRLHPRRRLDRGRGHAGPARGAGAGANARVRRPIR